MAKTKIENSYEIQTKELALEKLKAEVNKIQTETKELLRKRKERYITLIIAVILIIPTIWFYYKQFAEPFVQIDKIKLAKDLVNLKNEYENKLNFLEEQKDSLAEEKYALENEYLDLNRQKQKQDIQYQEQLKEIRDEYNNLRNLYKAKSNEGQMIRNKIDSLNSQIEYKDRLIKTLDRYNMLQSRSTVKPDTIFNEIFSWVEKNPVDLGRVVRFYLTKNDMEALTSKVTYSFQGRVFEIFLAINKTKYNMSVCFVEDNYNYARLNYYSGNFISNILTTGNVRKNENNEVIGFTHGTDINASDPRADEYRKIFLSWWESEKKINESKN